MRWVLIVALVNYFVIVIITQSPSDNARRKLVSLIGQVRQADGRRYAVRDHLGNAMNCVKIIKRTDSDDFIGVYHTYVDNILRVNLAISNDLLQWTWLRQLAVHASQPTIVVPADEPQGYLLVWEDTPSIHLKFAFYMTWDDLTAGILKRLVKLNELCLVVLKVLLTFMVNRSLIISMLDFISMMIALWIDKHVLS